MGVVEETVILASAHLVVVMDAFHLPTPVRATSPRYRWSPWPAPGPPRPPFHASISSAHRTRSSRYIRPTYPAVISTIDIPLDVVTRSFRSKRVKAVTLANSGPLLIRLTFMFLIVTMIGVLMVSAMIDLCYVTTSLWPTKMLPNLPS